MPPATPLERLPDAVAPGREVFLKREDLHELGAFKWRGALPVLEELRRRGATGVVTASTGNHGAATAWAARRVDLPAVVFVPLGASQIKRDRMASLGADVREVGTDFDASKKAASSFARERDLPFFEDGDEPAQYDGYRAIAAEILEQCSETPAAVVAPVGNGALIGGIGLELRERSPQTRLIGVVAKDAPVMALSHEAGRVVPCERMTTFADGIAVRVAIPRAVEILSHVVDSMVRVSERDLARAIGRYAAHGIRVEGAAAAPLAALSRIPRTDGAIVLVATGRNIDEALWRRAVESPDSFPD